VAARYHGEKIEFASDPRSGDAYEVSRTLAHELAHGNDYLEDHERGEFRNIQLQDMLLTALKKLPENAYRGGNNNLASFRAHMFDYPLSINHADTTFQTAIKMTEYFAVICEHYLTTPENSFMTKEEKRIALFAIHTSDPEFTHETAVRNAAIRYEIIEVTRRDKAERILADQLRELDPEDQRTLNESYFQSDAYDVIREASDRGKEIWDCNKKGQKARRVIDGMSDDPDIEPLFETYEAMQKTLDSLGTLRSFSQKPDRLQGMIAEYLEGKTQLQDLRQNESPELKKARDKKIATLAKHYRTLRKKEAWLP